MVLEKRFFVCLFRCFDILVDPSLDNFWNRLRSEAQDTMTTIIVMMRAAMDKKRSKTLLKLFIAFSFRSHSFCFLITCSFHSDSLSNRMFFLDAAWVGLGRAPISLQATVKRNTTVTAKVTKQGKNSKKKEGKPTLRLGQETR